MNYKSSKILSVIAAIIILVAFFMPWTKSMFGSGATAWNITEQGISLLSKTNNLPEDMRAFLPFLLIALPILSAVIIINSVKTISIKRRATRIPKTLTIIIFVLIIIMLVDTEIDNPFSDFLSIFELLSIGFYLTLISVIYYLIDMFTGKN